MKKRRSVAVLVAVLFLLVIGSGLSKGAALMLPFDGGSTWTCDQGNFNDPKNILGNVNETHLKKSSMEYAWDFNMGLVDLGKPVLAPAGGKVVYAQNSYSAWGNVVIIDYGDGTFGKLAHLDTISNDASLGKSVSRGQQVGTCGGTGGWPVHIHYQTQGSKGLNDSSIPSSFIDASVFGYTVNNGREYHASFDPSNVPKEDRYYTSLNTDNPHNFYRVGRYATGYVTENMSTQVPYSRPFVVSYYHNQGGSANVLGYPVNDVHLLENCYGCTWYGAPKAYVQDFAGGQIASSTLIMNPNVYNIRFNYLGVAYPIHGQMRDYWYSAYWQLGPPVTNEYYWNDSGTQKLVQWFEPSDNSYVAVVYHAGNFRQCTTSTAGCPPYNQQVFDQQAWQNLGCPNGSCGVGGGGELPPYSVTRTATCKGVQTYNPYDPINETSDFTNTDGLAYSWIRLDGVYGLHTFNWKWYAPDGTLALNNSHSIASDPAGLSYMAWDPLDISMNTSFGQWHVDTYVDGILMDTQYFNFGVVLNQPSNLAMTNVTASTVALNWSVVQNATLYRVYRNGQQIAEVTQPAHSDTGLLQNTYYVYHVIAVSGSYTSPASADVAVMTAYLAPGPPSGLSAGTITSSSISINWTAGTNASGYRVYRGEQLVAETGQTNFTNISLLAGTSYAYYVVSVNGDLSSAPSASIVATTSNSGPVLAAPTNVRVTVLQ